MGLYMDQKKNKILKILSSETRVSTRELSKKLNLSMETVRRYLDILEKECKIRRVHGGAEKLDSYSREENLSVRLTQREREKRRIARVAAELINDGDRIVIDDGSTTLQIVNFISGKRNLVVITSSFPVAIAVMNLLDNNKITGELIFIGGIVQSDNKRTIGSSSIDMINNYTVDKVFISCEGITLEDGITSSDKYKAELSKKYILQGRESILLADHSKIGVIKGYKINKITGINRIITNKEMPKEWRKKLEEFEVRWDKV